MSRRIDLTGHRFSRLTVLGFVGVSDNGQALWECLCECGNIKTVAGHKLRGGEIKSCGCAHYKYGHGMTNTRLYNIWCTMKARCTNPNSNKYGRYGGRGIKVCSEWLSDFKAFYDWAMANDYSEELSIDRIDYNGDYNPENCRWVTAKEQANNTSNNVLLTYNEQIHTISEWAEMCGLTYSALYHRLGRGWPLEKALSTPMLNF